MCADKSAGTKLKQSMNLIIIHKNTDMDKSNGKNLLRFALAHEPMAGLLLDDLSRYIPTNSAKNSLSYSPPKHNFADIIYAIPKKWDIAPDVLKEKDATPRQFHDAIIRYSENIQITSDLINRIGKKKSPESWFVITNGRFATRINNELLGNIITNIRADIVAVNADPGLLNKREKIRLTKENNIAGFRRLYSDSAEFVPDTDNWPHHLLIKTHIFMKLFKQ